MGAILHAGDGERVDELDGERRGAVAMGILDDLKRLLRRESREAQAWVAEAVDGGHRSLDRAERRVSADPDERLAATLDDIAEGEDDFAAIRAKADAATARPAAEAEVVAVERDEDGDEAGAGDEHDLAEESDPGGPLAQ
jgi:hypothetical protein